MAVTHDACDKSDQRRAYDICEQRQYRKPCFHRQKAYRIPSHRSHRAAKGDKCYDCDSPERICRALTVLWKKPNGVKRAEVVLIDQELGY